MIQMLKKRFRGFLPIVVDVETAGFNAKTDALLEIAAINVQVSEAQLLELGDTLHEHVAPFKGANLNPDALEFNQIKPFHPFRLALNEREAMEKLEQFVEQHLKQTGCQKAILVGHNAHFDHSFIAAACQRQKVKFMFHSFSTLDTVSLSALLVGETVLAKALKATKLGYDAQEAHSALYDATQTAKLFCHFVNHSQYQAP
ncbi:MAG: ribonuclease T [Legionellales bacterium]|nr:ribonuclease T [Legionellales bacterium]OUX67085.1 MAG: ribonuclease T [bacterium TMED178]